MCQRVISLVRQGRIIIIVDYMRFSPKAASYYCVSKQSPFRERYGLSVADNEMIQYADVDQSQRLCQTSGNVLVRLARFSDARWMIVSKDNSGSIVCQ